MSTFLIRDNSRYALPEGPADFLLGCSVSHTCGIEGITQAGLPGLMPLTPTLDAEFLATGGVFALESLPETSGGIPSPALLTRAVHALAPFSAIEVLDLGFETLPQGCSLHSFGMSPSQSIAEGAGIDAAAVFEKGRSFGREYTPKGGYVMFAECVPSGTTTAYASARALGYDTKNAFASSFKDSPLSIKEQTVERALSKINDSMTSLEKLGFVSDNMLIFGAGFVLEASRRYEVVLAGGTQMTALLLIADKLRQELGLAWNHENITLATTCWVAKDGGSDIARLLAQLSEEIGACYSDFSFAEAKIPVFKCYDEGDVKEGVGAGAAIAYGYLGGLSNETIVTAVEALMAPPTGKGVRER